MKPNTLALAALLLSAAAAGVQGPASLDAVRDWEVPGLSIAVVRNDSVLLARAYAVRALGEPGAVDGHTLFGIMSTTKAMTAAALAMLVDDGKVQWNDPVSRWLPELQFHDPYVTRELTVRDLLLHDSEVGNADLMWIRGAPDLPELLARVRYLEPEYPLRSSLVYHSIMYAAAGEVVERASGLTSPEFLRTRDAHLSHLQRHGRGRGPERVLGHHRPSCGANPPSDLAVATPAEWSEA